jgi:hypothetical protein
MMLAAAERATQIRTVGVARMGEEPNPAVFADHRATGQFGTSFQNGVERDLILTNKRTSTLLLVPILGKGENLLDAYDEKARLPAMLWILSCISSSYLLDAKAPRGGRGFSSCFQQKTDQARRPNTPRPKAYPAALPSPARTPSLRAQVLNRLPGKEKAQTPTLCPNGRFTPHHFFFPSSGSSWSAEHGSIQQSGMGKNNAEERKTQRKETSALFASLRCRFILH